MWSVLPKKKKKSFLCQCKKTSNMCQLRKCSSLWGKRATSIPEIKLNRNFSWKTFQLFIKSMQNWYNIIWLQIIVSPDSHTCLFWFVFQDWAFPCSFLTVVSFRGRFPSCCRTTRLPSGTSHLTNAILISTGEWHQPSWSLHSLETSRVMLDKTTEETETRDEVRIYPIEVSIHCLQGISQD